MGIRIPTYIVFVCSRYRLISSYIRKPWIVTTDAGLDHSTGMDTLRGFPRNLAFLTDYSQYTFSPALFRDGLGASVSQKYLSLHHIEKNASHFTA